MTTKDFILLGAGYAAGRMSKKMQAGPIGALGNDDKLKIYNTLEKGDRVKIKYGTSISSGNEKTLVVSKGRTKLMKGKVERITFKSVTNPTGVKYYLYNRGGKITFAVGDFGAVIDDIKKV